MLLDAYKNSVIVQSISENGLIDVFKKSSLNDVFDYHRFLISEYDREYDILRNSGDNDKLWKYTVNNLHNITVLMSATLRYIESKTDL